MIARIILVTCLGLVSSVQAAGLNVEWLNVKTFGAKGDGKTDDTAAIQKCLDVKRNGVVGFPAGTYLISSTLKVRNTHRLTGETYGRNATVIKAASGFKGDAVIQNVNWPRYNSQIVIENLTVDCGLEATGKIVKYSKRITNVSDTTGFRVGDRVWFSDATTGGAPVGTITAVIDRHTIETTTAPAGSNAKGQIVVARLTAVRIAGHWLSLSKLFIQNARIGIHLGPGGGYNTLDSIVMLDSIQGNAMGETGLIVQSSMPIGSIDVEGFQRCVQLIGVTQGRLDVWAETSGMAADLIDTRGVTLNIRGSNIAGKTVVDIRGNSHANRIRYWGRPRDTGRLIAIEADAVGNTIETNVFVDAKTPDWHGVVTPPEHAGYIRAGELRLGGDHLESLPIRYADEPPHDGTYPRGAILLNAGATPGGYAGWICVEPGTPGKWNPFGKIAPDSAQ